MIINIVEKQQEIEAQRNEARECEKQAKAIRKQIAEAEKELEREIAIQSEFERLEFLAKFGEIVLSAAGCEPNKANLEEFERYANGVGKTYISKAVNAPPTATPSHASRVTTPTASDTSDSSD
jgi:hypothetical protein